MHQVLLDLKRTHLTEDQQLEISERIRTLLDRYPHLNYYQGFHDVALNSKDYDQLERLSLGCLRDFMTPKLTQTLLVLDLVPQLLLELDPSFTIISGVSPHYALAPILTLFSHDTNECKDVLECVELAGIEYILYFYAAVILESKPYIYKELQGESEPEMVMAVLTRTSAQIGLLDRPRIHSLAEEYARQVPIDTLPAYAKLSRWSAVHGLMDLEAAEIASRKIAEPASYAGLVTVGVLVAAVLVQWVMSE